MREPVAVTPTTLGTIRKFQGRQDLKNYLRRVTFVNRAIRNRRFASFEIIPARILGIDLPNLRVLEQAHRAPDMWQLNYCKPPSFMSRYGEKFWERMTKKGAWLKECREDLAKAYLELCEAMDSGKVPHFDNVPSNILVLDYDPPTGRFQFCIVDHGGSIPR